MKHKSIKCQETNNIKNTASFWNNILKVNKSKIIKSPIYTKKVNLVIKQLSKLSGKVLDIGFGYGYLEDIVYSRNLNLKLFGVDISKYAVDRMNKKKIGTFLVSSVYKIPFNDRYFDSILILDVLEHIPKRRTNEALREMYRLLKPGGVIIVSVPLNESNIDRLENRHHRNYDKHTIKSELTNSNFKIIQEYKLTAFSSLFHVKNWINDKFNFRKPNLFILIGKKT